MLPSPSQTNFKDCASARKNKRRILYKSDSNKEPENNPSKLPTENNLHCSTCLTQRIGVTLIFALFSKLKVNFAPPYGTLYTLRFVCPTAALEFFYSFKNNCIFKQLKKKNTFLTTRKSSKKKAV